MSLPSPVTAVLSCSDSKSHKRCNLLAALALAPQTAEISSCLLQLPAVADTPPHTHTHFSHPSWSGSIESRACISHSTADLEGAAQEEAHGAAALQQHSAARLSLVACEVGADKPVGGWQEPQGKRGTHRGSL